MKLLFVCLGNICRSAAAEAVMKKLATEQGVAGKFQIDSAGLINYHEGEPADPRMRAHAARRGFYDFDLIIGMDDRNIDELKRKAPDLNTEKKIHRMTEYANSKLYDHVPDPYYSGAEGFELVLDLLEDACKGLLDHCIATTQQAK